MSVDAAGAVRVSLSHSQPLAAGVIATAMCALCAQGGVALLGGDAWRPSLLRMTAIIIWSFVALTCCAVWVWVIFGVRVLELRGGVFSVKWGIGRWTFGRKCEIRLGGSVRVLMERFTLKYKGNTADRYRIVVDDGIERAIVLSDLSPRQSRYVLASPLGGVFGASSVPRH